MGEIRQRTYQHCTVCGLEASRACREAGHAIEPRTWPTWWIRYYRDGRRHEESAGTIKRSEALALLRLREGDIARGVPVTARVGRLRFEEAAKDLENDYAINGKRTLQDLRIRIKKHMEPFFNGRRLAKITTDQVRSYIAQR